MMSTLSERVAKPSKDLLEEIFKCDTVQKTLLSGDPSGNNKLVFQRAFRAAVELKERANKRLGKMQNFPGMKADEKAFADKLVSDYPSAVNKYIEDFKAAVGPVPDSIMSAPLSPSVQRYHQRYDELLDKGSAVHSNAATLACYEIPVAIQNYLAANPSHKKSIHTDLATLKPLQLDQGICALKGFLNNRANEVNPALEAELIAIYREFTQYQLNALKEFYTGNHIPL